VSTSTVDTLRGVKIWTKNLADVSNEFLLLIHVPYMIQNKTKVLNLKTRKTQVPIGYLTIKSKNRIKILYNYLFEFTGYQLSKTIYETHLTN
jgi:hypothetical protein